MQDLAPRWLKRRFESGREPKCQHGTRSPCLLIVTPPGAGAVRAGTGPQAACPARGRPERAAAWRAERALDPVKKL